jgi:hypothetical protein
MKRTTLLTTALFTITMSTLAQSALPAAPAAYGVRGDNIGENFQLYIDNNHLTRTKKGLFPTCAMDTPKTWHCDQIQTKYIPEPILTLTTYYFDNYWLDRIESVFDNTEYAATRAAIANKYGEPTSTEIKTYTNAFGATFQGEVAHWDQKDSAINLFEVSVGGTNQSHFYIFNPATELARRAAAQAKANANF